MSICWLAINKRAERDASEIRLQAIPCIGVRKEYCSRRVGRKETAERIQHKYCPRPNPWRGSPRSLARQNTSPTIAWTSFLKREDSSTTTINRHHYQQPCHWDPRITFTESWPSPPPRLTGSDRHRHHRTIAIAAKTNKTSEKNGSRMQREKKDSARGGERDEERSWLGELLPLILLKNEGEFTARMGRVKIYCPYLDVDGRCLDSRGRGGKIPPKIE